MKMFKKILLLIPFLLIVIFSLEVRKKNFAEIPVSGQSTDEYSYSWVGLSLLKIGVPVGVSGFPGYKNLTKKYINVDHYMQVIPSDPFEINYPWMDHPPFLGLITGGYAYLTGARNFADITSLVIRKPMIIIGTLSVILAMIFAWINFGYITALIGGLIYASTPLVVLSSRMIQAENAIIPCMLAVMIAMSLYIKKKRDYWLLIAGIITGVSTLFKLSGLVCYLFVFLALLSQYKKLDKNLLKDYAYFLAISLPITFLFFVYGIAYGWENFKTIFFSNYNRFYGIGANSLLELIRNQRLTQHKFLPEVWIISGWILFFASFLKNSKNVGDGLLKNMWLAYLITYIFFGSQPYGWYAFPFWPLSILLLGRILAKGIESGKDMVLNMLLSMMILGSNIDRLMNVFEFQKYAQYWRLGMSALIFLMLVLSILKLKSKWLSKMILVCLFILMIISNIKYLGMVNIDFWWQNIS